MASLPPILVEFDSEEDMFKYFPLKPNSTVVAKYPYNADPLEIRIKKKNPNSPWAFRAINFTGFTNSTLFSAVRNVTSGEKNLPVDIINTVDIALTVESLSDDEIVVKNTNTAADHDIIINFEITVENTKDNSWWTSKDPQIINEKSTG